jgi:D-alanyl-D-alanine carboxypeptidase
MIEKSLVALSIICNLVGFNLSATKTDTKLADFYAKEDYQSVSAADSINLLSGVVLPIVKDNAAKAYINTKNYALIDGDTGILLLGKNQDDKVPIASTTKIMTAVVALENYKLDEVVTVPYKATVQTPTVVNLRTEEKITVSELLHCLLIKSGNDSAYALAAHMSGQPDDIKPFVDKMNEKTKTIGLNNTHYLDPAGLSDEGYSTANDLGTITRYALLNPTFREIVTTQKYVATNTTKTIFHQLENSNRLVTAYQYPGAIGVKTGFTYAASHCLIAAAKRNGHTLVAVILGTYVDSATASADEARKLLDWGFANVIW